MRRYPGRSERLFEAPLPDLTPHRVESPGESFLSDRLDGACPVLAYRVEIASWSLVDIQDVLRAFADVMGDGGEGDRRGAGAETTARRFAVGDRAGRFRVLALRPAEAILGLEQRHLGARVSLLLGNDARRRWLIVTLAGRGRTRLGRLFCPLVRRLAERFAPATVARLARAIDTPRPEPPWRRFLVQR